MKENVNNCIPLTWFREMVDTYKQTIAGEREREKERDGGERETDRDRERELQKASRTLLRGERYNKQIEINGQTERISDLLM